MKPLPCEAHHFALKRERLARLRVQVLLHDGELSNRLHVVIALRDVVFVSDKDTEHGVRRFGRLAGPYGDEGGNGEGEQELHGPVAPVRVTVDEYVPAIAFAG